MSCYSVQAKQCMLKMLQYKVPKICTNWFYNPVKAQNNSCFNGTDNCADPEKMVLWSSDLVLYSEIALFSLPDYINQVSLHHQRVKLLYSILFYPITLGGHRGTTDEFATIPFHLDLFSAALVVLAKSIPIHSLILSSHLFFCLLLFLFPFTVPCRIVFDKPEDLETWPNHLSFRFLTRVRSSSYSPMAAWIFLRTSSLVT